MTFVFVALFLGFLISTSTGHSVDSVALIIGGVDPNPGQFRQLNEVELFGCEGTTEGIPVASLPRTAQQMGGLHYHNPNGALVCGGYTCLPSNEDCSVSSKCYVFNPAVNNSWRADVVPDMPRARWNYLMAFGPDLTNTVNTENRSAIALGYFNQSDIHDWETNTWKAYYNVSNNWYGCLVQDENDTVYHIGNTVSKLDMTTWNISEIGAVPQNLENPGKCSLAVIDGKPGIFTRFGFFFQFEEQKWTLKKLPPVSGLANLPNSMFQFRSRPTIFGSPECDILGNCKNKHVLQYVPETNEWTILGNMVQPRINHLVIEVDKSFCDYFVNQTTSTTTSTTTTTETTTLPTTTVTPPTTPAPTTTATSTTATTSLASSTKASAVFLAFLSFVKIIL